MDKLEALSYQKTRSTLQSLNYGRNWNIGRRFKLNMNVVTICIDSEDMECRVLLDDFIHAVSYILFDYRNDEFTSILGAPDNVILKLVY